VSRDSPYKHTQKYSLYLMSISRTKKKYIYLDYYLFWIWI
jgi:hypothetical protein